MYSVLFGQIFTTIWWFLWQWQSTDMTKTDFGPIKVTQCFLVHVKINGEDWFVHLDQQYILFFFFCSESFHTLSWSRAWIVRYHLHESTLDKSSHHFTYLAKTEFFSPRLIVIQHTAHQAHQDQLFVLQCHVIQSRSFSWQGPRLHCIRLSCRAAFSGSLLYGVRRPNQVAKIRKRWKVRVCFLQRTQHGSQWPA